MSAVLSWLCWRIAFKAGDWEATKAKLRGKPWDFDPRTMWWAAAVRFGWMSWGRFLRRWDDKPYHRETDLSACWFTEIP